MRIPFPRSFKQALAVVSAVGGIASGIAGIAGVLPLAIAVKVATTCVGISAFTDKLQKVGQQLQSTFSPDEPVAGVSPEGGVAPIAPWVRDEKGNVVL